MTPKIVSRPSPNFNERPDGVTASILVLHYTGMPTAEGAMALLTDPDAMKRVSAHYTLDEDGTFYQHVPEHLRAWHGGISWWRGGDDVNSRSIWIEIVNPGHEWGYRAFPVKQINALIALGKEIVARHGIRPQDVVGHSDIAPGRKIDPGELFPWRRLAGHGLGIWPARGKTAVPDDPAHIAAALRTIGYGVQPEVPTELNVVLAEFQRHWRPAKFDGMADLETRQRLHAVATAQSASSAHIPI